MLNKQHFISKDLTDFYKNSAYAGISFDKPLTCPHCDINGDAALIDTKSYLYDLKGGGECFFFIWRCTVCKKLFVSLHLLRNKHVSLLGVLPDKKNTFSDDDIEKISPRFIEIYNQALRAEHNGDYTLAAVGFRTALEILIKDYAITCLNQPHDDVIKLNLYNSITEYLGEDDLVKTADVIRILGNDHTHYVRKYPEYDFALLKSYADIVIPLIKTKIMIKHPPVHR